MIRRSAWILALTCVVAMPAAAQLPPLPESPQTVTAAIPPQTPKAASPAAPAVPPQQATAPVPPQARPAQPPVPATAPPVTKRYEDYEASNVKVDVTITYQVGNGKPVQRTASLTVADQGRGSLRSGTQLAVPSTTFQPTGTGGPATVPLTSYSYKSVGLNVDANRVSILGSKARMDLNVEFSAVDEKAGVPGVGGGYPLFPTFSQNLTLVLESGKEVVVGQSSDVVDNQERKQTVTVKATILR